MTPRLYFLVILVCYVAFNQINGQDSCVPAAVRNIVLYDEHVLSWSPSANEACTIIHYYIDIQGESDEASRLFWTNETVLDVGHLPNCEDVRFTITAVSSANIEGTRTSHYTKTAAPPDVDLDLTYFRLATYEQNGVRLEWDVDDEWKKCLKEYRLVSYNEDDDDIFLTMYMFSPYTNIHDLIPCTSYVFTVTALYNLQTEGHVSVLRYRTPTAKIAAPSLQRISSGSTTADLTWGFTRPTVNRCPVTALIVDGSPYFNIIYPISGQNQITRPAMSIRLSSLQPDSMYVLHVSANNSAGLSQPFIVGVQTLEQ